VTQSTTAAEPTPTPTPTSTPTTAKAAPATKAPSASKSVTVAPPAAPAQSSARGCGANPSSCGYPDAKTTGIQAGVSLGSSACIRSTSPGQVIQNITLNCDINVTSENVVIRNVKIKAPSVEGWGIIIRGGASATIDHVDVSGLDKSGQSMQYAVLSQTDKRVTISNSNLYNCADCIQGENLNITGNYIHDLANPPGAHVDGIQCNSYCGLTVTGNTILNEWGQTATVALFADFGTPRNSTISGNLLAGGGYSIYGGGDGASNITITNNRFSKLYFPNGGQFGTRAHIAPGTVLSGNIWDDSGAAA
jgi:hypothetical protein